MPGPVNVFSSLHKFYTNLCKEEKFYTNADKPQKLLSFEYLYIEVERSSILIVTIHLENARFWVSGIRQLILYWGVSLSNDNNFWGLSAFV